MGGLVWVSVGPWQMARGAPWAPPVQHRSCTAELACHPPAPSLLVLLPQFLYLVFSIVVTLPLTLAVDGTDWSAQFDGWLAGDWAVLVATGSVVTIAANYCIQHSMWQLGAPLVSMFYGERMGE